MSDKNANKGISIWVPKVDTDKVIPRLSRKRYKNFETKPANAKRNYGKKKKKWLRKQEEKRKQEAVAEAEKMRRRENWNKIKQMLWDLDAKRRKKKV